MKKNVLMRCLFTLLLLVLCNACTTKAKAKPITVTVEINSGSSIEKRKVTVEKNTPVSALEALSRVANIETHPVGEYVFVTAIDGLKGERGVKAWYYEVNGKPTGTLAINKIVNDGDTITWIYREDVCSSKVDGKK